MEIEVDPLHAMVGPGDITAKEYTEAGSVLFAIIVMWSIMVSSVPRPALIHGLTAPHPMLTKRRL